MSGKKIPFAIGLISSISIYLLHFNPLHAEFIIPKDLSNLDVPHIQPGSTISLGLKEIENAYSLTVLAGWQHVQGDHEHPYIGIQIDLQPGWKTYWRHAGPTGLPMSIEWTETRNLQSFSIRWPSPTLFDQFGVLSIGYANHVLFPIQLEPVDEDLEIVAHGVLTFGICKDVCIPVFEQVAIHVSPHDRLLSLAMLDALASIPTPLQMNRPTNSHRCWHEENENYIDLFVEIDPSGLNLVQPAVAVPEDPSHYFYFYPAELKITEEGRWLFHSRGEVLNRAAGRPDMSRTAFTIVSGHETVAFTGC